jgi:hypothetical protein
MLESLDAEVTRAERNGASVESTRGLPVTTAGRPHGLKFGALARAVFEQLP